MIFDHMNRDLGFTPITPADVINTEIKIFIRIRNGSTFNGRGSKTNNQIGSNKKPFLPPFPLEKELDKRT